MLYIQMDTEQLVAAGEKETEKQIDEEGGRRRGNTAKNDSL